MTDNSCNHFKLKYVNDKSDLWNNLLINLSVGLKIKQSMYLF